MWRTILLYLRVHSHVGRSVRVASLRLRRRLRDRALFVCWQAEWRRQPSGDWRAVLFSVFLFCFVRFSASGETSRVHSVRTRRVDVWSKQIIKTFVFYFVFFTKQVFDLFSAVYCCIRLIINNTPRCCLPLLCTVKFCALICVPFVIISQTTKITLSLLCQKVNVYFSTIFTFMLNTAFICYSVYWWNVRIFCIILNLGRYRKCIYLDLSFCLH